MVEPPWHILVVDDDTRLRELLLLYLQESGFTVSQAEDSAAARQKILKERFDLMVLDIMMPGETGTSLAKSLRAQGQNIPILMLTAMGEPNQRIEGLETGVDDYLTKPFEPRELVLRIRGILRRNRQKTLIRTVQFGPFTFDTATLALVYEGASIALTSSEAVLLKVLAQHLGEPVSREELARQSLAGGGLTSERSVDVQINRLRKKIEPEPAKPIYIQTIRHAGYMLKAEAK